MLTRISAVTTDHETTAAIAEKMPMMPVFELNFEGFSAQMEPLYASSVKDRLLDILRLRIGAILLENKLDALIGVPNQLWTSYLLNRTMYPPRFDLDEESILVQKLVSSFLFNAFWNCSISANSSNYLSFCLK
ncbi:unnamed protein product [Strongylus vulgaris]|uniref:Uncharacterized protein n=1 Tax=Strongylus vulgaris TaxID=40348 RepID=A0A3P7LTU0_STRVU|nr:unnamed protein product [Strongylus vulgaris]